MWNADRAPDDILERGPEPVVTVVTLTYNHEDYIREALDSFLMQKTSFRFQVYVGEDKGPDGTADIVREYAEKYPGIVIPFIRETNMGAQRNLIDMCQRAGTKYIAFCEGDDFWTDEYKLQKQYEHMEANPDLAGCFHNTEIQSDEDWYLTTFYRPDDEGRRLIPSSIPRYDDTVRAMRIGYYIRFGPAHTSSMFFKWNYDLEVPEWYYTTIFGDHPIMAMQLGKGLLGFMPDVMSVYRRHAGGLIMNNSERDHHLRTRKDWLVVLEGLAEHFHRYHGGFAVGDIEARMVTEMRNYLAHAVRSQDRNDVIDVITRHPLAFERMMNDYTQTSTLRYRLIARLWGDNAAGLRQGALSEAMSVISSGVLLRRRQNAEENRAKDYDGLADSAKRRDLWLFMCDDKVSYRSNVRSLFEHVVANHPEIEPYWLTWSGDVKDLLRSEGLPIGDMRSAQARKLLGEASVLFCESLRTDIFEMRGFNAGLRVVRLLENRYHRNHEHTEPSLASETRTDEFARADSSPRDWRSSSNLVVTDSGVLAEQLRSMPHATPSQVRHIGTEPRLLAVRERLTPVRRRHVLLNAGQLAHQQAEAFAVWLIEHADALDDIARRHGLVLDISMPHAARFIAPVGDRIDELEHLALLKTFDVYAHLDEFAAAVSGPDVLLHALARKGVPVSICAAGDPDGTWRHAVAGPIADEWMDAVETMVALVEAASPDSSDGSLMEDAFGVAPVVDADALESLFDEVRSWLSGGSGR